MAIIMISRGTFSGARAVAEKLAAQLNYPCVSNDILFEAAEEFGVPEERLTAALHEPPGLWQQRPGKRIAHMNFVRAALFSHVTEGNLVYHGYAGHFLMPGISHVLRVRITAGLEYRLHAAMTERRLSREKAMELIEKDNRKAEQWTKALYGVSVTDPSLFDVILNLDGMSIDAAVAVIAHLATLPGFTPTQSSMAAFEDLRLASLVWAELSRDRVTQSADVRVSADQGGVTVTGKADSRKTVESIPAIAGRVAGVSSVRNDVGIGSDWAW